MRQCRNLTHDQRVNRCYTPLRSSYPKSGLAQVRIGRRQQLPGPARCEIVTESEADAKYVIKLCSVLHDKAIALHADFIRYTMTLYPHFTFAPISVLLH